MARAGSLTFPLYPRFLGNHDQIRLPLLFYFFPFFSIPFMIFALLFALPPSRNSDPGSHSRLFSPPTHYGSRLAFFFREKIFALLPSSTRVELCLPTLGALSSYPFFIFAYKFKISPRRDSNSRTNTSSIRGIPLVHRGDRLQKQNPMPPDVQANEMPSNWNAC